MAGKSKQRNKFWDSAGSKAGASSAATREKTFPREEGGKRNEKKKLRLFYVSQGFDMPFLTILMILLVVGLISLFTASFAHAHFYNDDSFFYIKRQLVFAVIGITAMLVASMVDYHIWHKLALILTVVSIILLILVLIIPTAQSARTGIKRWIWIGDISIQPSEIAKFSIIVLFSHMIALNHKKMKTFFGGFAPFMTILGIVCVLVIKEPHLSGTILIFAIGICMMFVGGTRSIYLILTAVIGVGAVVFMVTVLGYEADRIEVWLKPMEIFSADAEGRDQAWQTVQSLYAIGSGGIMGQGLGQSRQKHMYLPEPHNDFIFAVICEELGLVGAVLVIVLFVLLVWRGITIGMKAKNKFGSMLAIGLSVQIGIQALLNIAVVTNTIPNTGISLPFFSYGGSSLIMLLGQMGIVLAVSRQTNRDVN